MDVAATAHFVDKWWQREPEMRIAAAFCARADAPGPGDPARARARFECWGALLHELREALFELPEASVAGSTRVSSQRWPSSGWMTR